MFGRKPSYTFVEIKAPERVQHLTREIHEHRAPTDDSVRLLREMEQAARDAVDERYVVADNGFECVVERCIDNMSDRMVARAIFALNGRRHTVEADVRTRQYSDDPYTLVHALVDAVANVLAREILLPALMQEMK